MDTEARYQHLCRLGMLAAAVLHWVAAALILWPITGESTWNYSGAHEGPRICYLAAPPTHRNTP